MSNVPPSSIPIALEKCSTSDFEKYSQSVLASAIGHSFKPLGGTKDGGADGFIDSDVREDVQRATTFFQASKEIDPAIKIRKTVRRLREFGREVKTLHYATSREVKHIDKLQSDLSDELDINVRIYDVSYFEQRANHSDDVKAAYYQYLQPSLVFLEEALAPSYPSSPVLANARV